MSSSKGGQEQRKVQKHGVKRSGNRVGFEAMELDSRHGESNFLFSPATEVMYNGCKEILSITSMERGN